MKVPGHRSSQPSLSVGIRISPTSAPPTPPRCFLLIFHSLPSPLLSWFYCSNPLSPSSLFLLQQSQAATTAGLCKVLLSCRIKTNLMDGAVRYKIERKDANSPKITSILSASLAAAAPVSTLNLASGSFSGSNSWQFRLPLGSSHSRALCNRLV